jgi:hypothetical protein
MRFWAWVVLALTACGPGGVSSGGEAFSMSFREREGVPLSRIHSHARAAARTSAAALAVGVTETEVIGQPLDGNRGWRVPLVAVQEPALAGGIVVVVTAAEYVALDARRGTVQWRLPSQGRPLFGIDDDGKRTVLTYGQSPTVLSAFERTGKKLMEVEAPHLLGVPAVRGPYVFVPWRDQFVSVFEVETGNEVGRVVSPRQVSHAVAFGDELYFGEDAMLRFDRDVAAGGAASGMWQGPNTTGLPGKPHWFERGRRTQSLPLTAQGFARVLARPGETNLEQGTFASTYFRVAMGFDAETRALHWVSTMDRPIIGGAAVAGGFVFCTSDGRLTEVSRVDGASRQLASLGGTLSGCAVGAGEHQVANKGGEIVPFHQQLSQAVLHTDPQMAAAQVFLLRQMRHLTEPTLTQTLIEILERPYPTPELAEVARELLARRETGAEYMLAALKKPYDFLAGVERAPPVGAIAFALVNLDQSEAAPLLAAHLNDPIYDAESVKAVAVALSTLARKEQIPELSQFFALNYASADNAAMAGAVNAVADTLLRLEDTRAQRAIQVAARDKMTHPVVRAHLEELFEWDSEAARKLPSSGNSGTSVGKAQ